MGERGGGVSELSWLEATLIEQMNQAHAAGVAVEAVVRVGDPASELMKFRAASGPFQPIVWGGSSQGGDARRRGRGWPWRIRTAGQAGCPLVVPWRKA